MLNSEVLINPKETLFRALEILQIKSIKCLIVVNNKNRLLGTINDGDIRRAILKGSNIKSTIVSAYRKKCYYIVKTAKTIDWSAEASEKGGFEHYMLKEIHEQPNVIRTIIQKHIQNNRIQFKGLNDTVLAQLKDSPRFIIQACGTSWHAGIIGKYLFEQYARIPTEVDISS